MSNLCQLVHGHEHVPCLGTCSCERNLSLDFNSTECIIGSFSNVDDNDTIKKSFFFSKFVAVWSRLKCQLWLNILGVYIFRLQAKGEGKHSSSLFTSSVKRPAREFHVVFVQKTTKIMYKKMRYTLKVDVLLLGDL